MECKILVLDVDGTLTDGKIYMSHDGELMKSFNIKDGYALSRLKNKGIIPVIITGRESVIVEKRCAELGIDEIYQGVSDKAATLKNVCTKLNITLDECAYIGDDLNDLECMELCGISACPRDAVAEVKEKVHYVCSSKGGEGAVREFCDYLINNK